MASYLRIVIIPSDTHPYSYSRFVGFNVSSPAATVVVDGPFGAEHVVAGNIDYKLTPNIIDRWLEMAYVLTEVARPYPAPNDELVVFVERVVMSVFTIGVLSQQFHLPTTYHPIVVSVMYDRLRRAVNRDTALLIEISNSQYDGVLSVYKFTWHSITFAGAFFDGPTRAVVAVTNNLLISRITAHNPESIALTIEQTRASTIDLDASVPAREYANSHVRSMYVAFSPFSGRFPRLELLRMEFDGPKVVDSTHCPRLVTYATMVKTRRELVEILSQIPTLTRLPPMCREVPDEGIIAEYAPHLVAQLRTGIVHWHPRLNAEFWHMQRQMAAFFLAINRLVAANHIAYPDPAALEYVLRSLRRTD
jgi:hypothetical protein